MIPLRAIAFGAALAFLAGSHLWAYRSGVSAERVAQAEDRAKLQDDLFAAAERHSRAAAELALLRADRETLAMEFEDNARADPAAADRRPSPDSLRRLETLWQGARGTP
jgi:hypothetical protein